MSTLHLSDTVFVRRDPVAVFAYASDFRRAHEWRTEVVESSMSPDGPMRPGSLLREVAMVAGRRIVTDSVVDSFDEHSRFSFTHRSGPMPVSGAYTVTPTDGGAVLRYDLEVELFGAWALLTPVFRVTGPRMMAESLDEFRFRLEASALPLAC